jgi:hypothetical protein
VAGSARSAREHSIPHSLLDAGEIDPDRLAAWE